ncbi:MAG: GNAT family N-acetyltransferase [Myxococcota bacterium]
MTAPRSLETKRLWLVQPGPAEAEAVVRYFERNRAHLEPWEPERPRGFYTPAFWRARLEANLSEAQSGLAVRYFLLRPGPPNVERVIGTCNFTNITMGAFCACNLGYGLDAEHVGQGLMTEAIAAAMPAVMEAHGLHRVMANYIPENARSGAVLERLGFKIEGLAPKYLYLGGEWRDHVLTSFVRD